MVFFVPTIIFSGCTSNHQILKYDSPIKTGDNLISGIEPEESSRKIMIMVKGKGLEPENGTPIQKRFMAERAAVIDGYKKLAERIAGAIIEICSTSENNTVSMDQIMIETRAYLRGAQIAGITYQNGYVVANVKVYIEPRQVRFYHGSKISRAILGALGGASIGAVAGATAGPILGGNSAALSALGGQSGAMGIGGAGGTIGGVVGANQ